MQHKTTIRNGMSLSLAITILLVFCLPGCVGVDIDAVKEARDSLHVFRNASVPDPTYTDDDQQAVEDLGYEIELLLSDAIKEAEGE